METDTKLSDIKIIAPYGIKDYVEKGHSYSWDELLQLLDKAVEAKEEADGEITALIGNYKELEDDVRDNYRPIPVAEQVGISDRDFI